MIKAIIFDFGRVITAQKPVSLFRSYEDELGLTPGTINTIMFDSQAWQDALVGRMTAGEFWNAIGPELNLNSVDEINRFKRHYHADEAINKDVLNLINRLHSHFKLAILSNAPPGLDRWLVDWHILNLFDIVFCSGEEGLAKPDPKVFKITLERLGVDPVEAIFIDDTKEHVYSAISLGIHGITFTTAEVLDKDLRKIIPKI